MTILRNRALRLRIRRLADTAAAAAVGLVPVGVAERRLLAALRTDSAWLPTANIEIAFEVSRRLRRLGDPGFGNRWLHHRWAHILEQTWLDITAAGMEPPRPGFRYLCVGPGVKNPYAFALLIRLAGASELTLVEPDPLSASDHTTEWGLGEMLLRVLAGDVAPAAPRLDLSLADDVFDLRRLLVGGSGPLLVGDRLRFTRAPIEEAELQAASFDFVSSRSVLEHVSNLDACYRRLAEVTAPGGLMYHEIDLSSHHPKDKLAMYRRPGSGDINEARLSDHLALLERHGFASVVVRSEAAAPERLERAAIQARFAGYSDDDLLCTGAVIVSRRL